MLELMMLYHFNRPIDTERCSVSEVEDKISHYIKKYLDAAELIDICVLGPEPLRRCPKFARDSQANVFIGLIITAERKILEEFIVNGAGLNDYILDGLSGESIYFLKYWNDCNHKYYAVKLLKFSGDSLANPNILPY